MIRKATTEDTMVIYDLLRPFFNEGHWSIGEFSSDNTVRYIMSFLHADHAETFLWDHNGVKGIIVVEVCYEFDVKPYGYITNFYVSPEARGTKAARSLFQSAVDHTKNCRSLYAGNSGIFTDRGNNLFGNLCKKFGFKEVSTNYARL